MALNLIYPDGATPLDPDEANGLIPRHITTHADLNEWEAANILKAQQWLYSRRRTGVLSEEFCVALHRRMFAETWRWAGSFRRTDKNIGCDWRYVGMRLRDLFDDTRYWLAHNTFPHDEAATRFHHRLVAIHCFPNGNGRHARMMTDALLREIGETPFTWGKCDLITANSARRQYLTALVAADNGDISQLLIFVRQGYASG